jgi:signal transduction histidine kinase
MNSRIQINLTRFLFVGLSSVALGGITTFAVSAEFGTAQEAKSLLQKAVAAVQANKTESLAKFHSGADGFKDRDLYVFCIGPDGIATAGPMMGKDMKDLKDKNGKMLGQALMNAGKEGEIAEVEYMWPRPGTTEAVRKTSFVTKVSDQVCGSGYYH